MRKENQDIQQEDIFEKAKNVTTVRPMHRDLIQLYRNLVQSYRDLV